VAPDLAGKVVIVTGASTGLGEAIARGCAGFGARVALTARSQDAGEAVAADIRATGDEAVFVRHDVSDEGSWRDMLAAVAAQCCRQRSSRFIFLSFSDCNVCPSWWLIINARQDRIVSTNSECGPLNEYIKPPFVVFVQRVACTAPEIFKASS